MCSENGRWVRGTATSVVSFARQVLHYSLQVSGVNKLSVLNNYYQNNNVLFIITNGVCCSYGALKVECTV